METFIQVLVLCLALLESRMIDGEHHEHHRPHHPTPSHGHHKPPTGHHRPPHQTPPHGHHNPPSGHHRPPHQSPHHGHHNHSTSHDNNTHDVMLLGAVGDGRTDDAKAFQMAWNAACEQESSLATVSIPGGKTYLVSRIRFVGPCKSPSITVEIFGKIVAPPRSAWENKEAREWMTFHGVDGLTVQGNGEGLIDGRGESWWKYGRSSSRPAALKFSHCNKLQVSGLKHSNSQNNHISINYCHGVTISKLDISAPEKSPNTDGIDISQSTNLHIYDCTMATGDDCIAICGGTSHVTISNIACGPGHGISIGSLGKKGNYDEVEAIHVRNCTFTRTQNGVRIKTWQGGRGFARNITFSGITFKEARNPVFIDQYYCPHKTCTDKASNVKVSDVRFSDLRGTANCHNATINIHCSKTVPCTNIVLDDINIRSADPNIKPFTSCTNVQGEAHTLEPGLNCLKNI